MKRVLTIVCASVSLISCGGSKDGAAPAGQVVATVDGDEITASELRLEMPGTPTDPGAAAAVQQTALQSIIARKLLVAEAKRRDLKKSPLAAMFQKRAEEVAMVQLLQLGVANGVPKVSDSEVGEFISSHPATFSQRRLISVERLLIDEIDPKIVQQMAPLDTLSEIEVLLTRNKVGFVRSAGVLDTLNLDPEAAAKIADMGSDEVFVAPNGEGGFQVSRISSSRIEPLMGEEANRVARLLLTRQRNTQQVSRAMEEVVKSGQSRVKINPAYRAPAASERPAATGVTTPKVGGAR